MLAADLSALREVSHVGAKLKLRTLLGEDVAGEVRVSLRAARRPTKLTAALVRPTLSASGRSCAFFG